MILHGGKYSTLEHQGMFVCWQYSAYVGPLLVQFWWQVVHCQLELSNPINSLWKLLEQNYKIKYLFATLKLEKLNIACWYKVVCKNH